MVPMRSCLIVDDHAHFRALARLLLEEEGYEVVGEAEDVESALAAARELSPDVVLLDVQLRNGDGFEVARRLAEEQPACAVVMTSTHDGLDFELLARRCGARGFVPKEELSATALARLVD